MVAVQVTEDDRVYLPGVDPLLLQGGKGHCPAVQHEGGGGGPHEVGCLMASAGAERVARSEESDVYAPHRWSIALHGAGSYA
jgi:hypothetical protein